MADSATHWKFTVTHYRRPEHTHEDFMKWIVEEHLPIALPIFKKHGVIEFALVSVARPDVGLRGLTCCLVRDACPAQRRPGAGDEQEAYRLEIRRL